MADNQTGSIMKNVILTHKELQLNLFYCFIEGLRSGFDIPGYHVSGQDCSDHFTFELWQSANGSVDGKEILRHLINKGAYQLNDVRLGVTSAHFRDESKQFKKLVREFMESANRTKPTLTKAEYKSRDEEEFYNSMRGVIKYLNDFHHPHAKAIITTTTGEVVYGEKSIGECFDYVKD